VHAFTESGHLAYHEELDAYAEVISQFVAEPQAEP